MHLIKYFDLILTILFVGITAIGCTHAKKNPLALSANESKRIYSKYQADDNFHSFMLAYKQGIEKVLDEHLEGLPTSETDSRFTLSRKVSFLSFIAMVEDDLELKRKIKAYLLDIKDKYEPSGDAVLESNFIGAIISLNNLGGAFSPDEYLGMKTWLKHIGSVQEKKYGNQQSQHWISSHIAFRAMETVLFNDERSSVRQVKKLIQFYEGIHLPQVSWPDWKLIEHVEILRFSLLAAVALHQGGHLNRNQILSEEAPLRNQLGTLIKLFNENHPVGKKLLYALEVAHYFDPNLIHEIQAFTSSAGFPTMSYVFYDTISPFHKGAYFD